MKTIIKDLGVNFDAKLSFADHVNIISAAALKTLGFIFRSTKLFTNMNALKCLYCSLVRSKLEYCSVILSPFYRVHSFHLEQVQRRFLKYLYFKIYNTYPERNVDQRQLLDIFETDSLSSRRSVASVVFLVKLIRGVVDCTNLLNIHV